MSADDRVIEGVESCDEDGCDKDRYPGLERCLGCSRRVRRAAR